MKDFYLLLGVPRDAGVDDIKRAYRNLAKKYHPDTGFSGDRETFLGIQRAYETLVDAAARADYDRSATGLRSVPVLEEISLFNDFMRFYDSFNEIFDYFVGHTLYQRDNWLPKSGLRRRLTLELILSPHEAAKGIIQPVKIPVREPCTQCSATDRDSHVTVICSTCKGKGYYITEKAVHIPIPRGVRDKSLLHYNLAAVGIYNIDLYIKVRISGRSRE